MDTISINADLTLEDWRAYQMAASRRIQGRDAVGGLYLRVLAVALATGAVMWLVDKLTHRLDVTSFVAGMFTLVGIGIVVSQRTRRRMTPDPNGAFLGHCAYLLDDNGLTASRASARSFASWAAVVDVTRTDTHVFVWLDRFSAYVLPVRDLPGEWTVERLTSWLEAARTRGAAPEVPVAPAANGDATRPRPTTPPLRWSFGACVLDVSSLIALRGKPVLNGAHEETTAALTTVAALVTWLLLDRWATGTGAELFVDGVSGAAWYVLGAVAVAWVLARASVPRIEFARAATVTALGAWLAILYTYLVGSLAVRGWLVLGLFVATMLYALAYLVQAARSLVHRPQRNSGLFAFIAVMGFFWITGQLQVTATLWTPAGSSDAYVEPDAVEPLLFAQRERLDEALDEVSPSEPGVPGVFFLGFAGYGNEKVFAEEIKFAARAVSSRYHSGSRSVLLLNDVRDLDAAPLATASTLRSALEGIADKMDVEEDILFLALSSHGSRDWELSVENGGLPLTNLRAEDIADALDEAGIQWRVIVISACYSGGFIDALKGPRTIVVTAAAMDRTSFGCSNDRELTDFGEAFYRDALPAATSLRDAFVQTQRLIGGRETARGVGIPSQPSASFGPEIERKLDALR